MLDPSEINRWDLSGPYFVPDVMRTMIGCWLLVSLIALLLFRNGFLGVFSGGMMAIALYAVAIKAGNTLLRSRSFARTMLWLLLSQGILWGGIALLIAVLHVNPVGFVLGVSILPVAIIVTLTWYALQRRTSPS